MMTSVVNQTCFAHIPCLVHTQQLSIFHGFKAENAETLLVKCQKIIKHFKA